jgi:hypothetical protein
VFPAPANHQIMELGRVPAPFLNKCCAPGRGRGRAWADGDFAQTAQSRQCHQEKRRSWPISRVLSRTIIHLGPLSPAASSNLPGSAGGAATGPLPDQLLPYSVLLQVGFSVPRRVTTRAVRSYRTISPLPRAMKPVAVYFLWHFPWARAPQALPGTLPAGARTFLPEVSPRAIAWPAPRRTLDHRRGRGNQVVLPLPARNTS